MLEVEPNNVDALGKKGDVLVNLGKFENAGLYFDKVLKLDPGNVNALTGKGNALAQLGNFEEAISYFNKVLEVEPNNVDALGKKGDALVNLGKFENAVLYFNKVLEVEPNNVVALGKKGDALVNLGNFENAVFYFDKVITISPYHQDESENFYIDKLLQLDPNHVGALYKRGKSLAIFVNQLDRAISFFDKALDIEPDRPDILTSKGEVLVNQENFEEAISYFNKALELDPNNLNAFTGKGNALAKLEKFEEAHAIFDSVISIQPNNTETLLQKGDAFRAQKNYEDSFLYFHKVLEIDPENFLAQNKFKLIYSLLNFTRFDGFVETIIRDPQGNLVSHLKINKLKYLDHPIVENMINDWNVTKTVNRNGTDYEVRQTEKVKNESLRTFHGGATHFKMELHKEAILRADHWFYEVDAGETVSLVFTYFSPIN